MVDEEREREREREREKESVDAFIFFTSQYQGPDRVSFDSPRDVLDNDNPSML